MLNLAEKLFLLAVDDVKGTSTKSSSELSYGLAGALLAELTLNGSLGLQNGRLVPSEVAFSGDELLEATFAALAEAKKPRKPAYWVNALAGKKPYQQIAGRLVDRGFLHCEEKRYLWVFPYQEYIDQNASAKYTIKQQLRTIVLASQKAEAASVTLLNLLNACSLLKMVFTKDERKAAGRKVKELAAGEVFGPAVAEVLASIDSALIATIAATSYS